MMSKGNPVTGNPVAILAFETDVGSSDEDDDVDPADSVSVVEGPKGIGDKRRLELDAGCPTGATHKAAKAGQAGVKKTTSPEKHAAAAKGKAAAKKAANAKGTTQEDTHTHTAI